MARYQHFKQALMENLADLHSFVGTGPLRGGSNRKVAPLPCTTD